MEGGEGEQEVLHAQAPPEAVHGVVLLVCGGEFEFGAKTIRTIWITLFKDDSPESLEGGAPRGEGVEGLPGGELEVLERRGKDFTMRTLIRTNNFRWNSYVILKSKLKWKYIHTHNA